MTNDAIGQALADGQAVVLPTETVYGLFARALDPAAVARVYALKGRPASKALNLNVASPEDIYAYSTGQPAYLDDLIKAFLPGPLTIILQANEAVPAWVNQGLATVGFRMPDHPATLAYVEKYGPLVGPSANYSGQASGRQFAAIMADFDDQLTGLADDQALTGLDSTILDLSQPKARILRQGAIHKDRIQAAIPDLVFDDDLA